MIKIEHLTKSYDDLRVLTDVNLHIRKGEVFGIVGRSGVGKSTLLRCINGLEFYNSGSLQVDGTEVGSLSPEQLRLFRKNVSMVFQQFSLITRASVYDNIAFAMKIWGVPKEEIDKRVTELLEVVGIPEKRNSKSRDLSGGQKQRVAIARALAMNPNILLCDEATSALDPKSTLAILNLLNEINRRFGITIIMVTHEMEVVKTLCDSVAIMANGVVEASGPVEKVFLENPPALVDLLGEKEEHVSFEGCGFKIIRDANGEHQQLLTQMARTLDLDFHIISNHTMKLKNKSIDSTLISLPDAAAAQAANYLKTRGVHYQMIGGNHA